MGWRHVVTLASFFGLFCMYTMRIDMSVAIVAMVNQTAVAAVGNNVSSGKMILCTGRIEELSHHAAEGQQVKEGKFVWSSETQGIVLSSFFYGYLLTQLFGGIIGGKYGGKWVFGIGNLLTGMFTLLSPLAAECGLGFLIAVRVIQGACSGVCVPAVTSLFARWVPSSERTTLPSFAYSGCFIGTPVTFLISGVLANSDILGGWPSIFYLFGITSCIWFALWTLLSSSGPENHRFISQEEKAYITKALYDVNAGQSKPGMKSVPWKEALTSAAVWAVIFSHFTYTWGLYVMVTSLPTYFKRVLGFDLKMNGFLSALPYFVQFIVQVLTAKSADILRVRFNMNTMHVRKLFDCLGHFLPAVCAAGLAFVGCNQRAAITLLVLGTGSTGLCAGGWMVNFLDIAPRYAGVLLGVSNTLSSISGIIGPYLTGILIAQNTAGGWRAVFLIIAAFNMLSTAVFAVFGQGDRQPWSMGKSYDIRKKSSDNQKTCNTGKSFTEL